MRLALTLNLIGTLALFFSFQATSSDFRLVSTSTGSLSQYSICIHDFTLLMTDGHSEVELGHQGCPTENNRPAAVVNTELPWLVSLGFVFGAAGFVIQILSFKAQPTAVSPAPRQIPTEPRDPSKPQQAKNKPRRRRGS